jgi:arginine:ornithine antiporter/lysine permease
MASSTAPAAAASPSAAPSTQKFSLPMLTGMVMGSIVDAGIFSLPRTVAGAIGSFGAIIAAGGMSMLTRAFQALREKRPDIDSGVSPQSCSCL